MPKLQRVLYPIFLVTCTAAAGLGLLLIWGMEPSRTVSRLLATCSVVAVASAFTMSATRLVTGRAPEDGDDARRYETTHTEQADSRDRRPSCGTAT